MNELKEFDLFKRICGEYQGKLVEEKDKVSFTSMNKIASYYQDGSVHTEKTLECRLKLVVYERENGKHISFQGEEESYAIKGGFGTTFSEESLRYNLQRYNFKPIGTAQKQINAQPSILPKRKERPVQLNFFDLFQCGVKL